jgi:23S rRNA (adenine2503-C2)-methyltransferase
MRVLSRTGREDVAVVYIAELGDGRLIEFVEAVQPPLPREKKWVLIVSSLFGCPVNCPMCDAGEFYRGKLSRDEILEQIEYLVGRVYPSGKVPVKKFKIQFSRMGEPAYNRHVLEALRELPVRLDAPGLLPTVSTIAPHGSERFFDQLVQIKEEQYRDRFQLQFSIHTTDARLRDWLIPVPKWDLAQIARYGETFYHEGQRMITLNFALAEGMPVDGEILLRHFDPDKFLVKITPVNPTVSANQNRIVSLVTPSRDRYEVIDDLRDAGYRVILSIGELAENHIGSNCGQHIGNYLRQRERVKGGYTQAPEKV